MLTAIIVMLIVGLIAGALGLVLGDRRLLVAGAYLTAIHSKFFPHLLRPGNYPGHARCQFSRSHLLQRWQSTLICKRT